MASISWISAWLISTTRMWVAMPRKSTSGSSTSASVAVRGPKPLALATSASATIAADSAVSPSAAAAAASSGPGAWPVLSVASIPLCLSARRPSGVCVGQGNHAVATLGDGNQAQVRALAGAEQRSPATRHDRDDDKVQLVDQAALEQRL